MTAAAPSFPGTCCLDIGDAAQGVTALEKSFGGKALNVLLDRLRHQLDTQGVLAELRGGFDLHPAPKSIQMAQFKPASGMNSALTARYSANRLRVWCGRYATRRRTRTAWT